jgi:hypothetical protein
MFIRVRLSKCRIHCLHFGMAEAMPFQNGGRFRRDGGYGLLKGLEVEVCGFPLIA